MHCWNCGKKIPDTAKVCRFCEVAVEDEPTESEKDLVWHESAFHLPERRTAFHADATAGAGGKVGLLQKTGGFLATATTGHGKPLK